jgi:hypothetical protein
MSVFVLSWSKVAYVFCLLRRKMPKPEITRRAAIIPAMVKVLEFELEDGIDVVSAVG